MTFSLRFSDVAELRNEKVDPATCSGSRYIGLEHIEQDSLSLSGWGTAEDVDSQKQRFYEGDILFGKLRPYFRKVVIAPFDGICSTDIWVVKPVIASDRDFVFYWMASDDFITRATNASEGTRMPRAKWDWVSGFELPEMSLEKRKIVGRILRVMDLTISLNRSISKTLEEIAQSIFRSWFVDFDPVKAKMAGEKPVGMDDATAALFPDSFEDSELGQIPSGWTVRNLGEICNIKQGRYLSPSQMVEKPEGVDTVPVIGGSGVLGYTSKSTFDFDVPLVTCRGSRCGLLQWGLFPSWVSNNAMAVTMQNSSKYSLFIYLFLKSTNLDNAITGSAQPQITITNLGYTRIVLPSTPILDAFSDLTEQMRDAVKSVNLESETLTKIREAILPRLISGELKIPEEMLVS